MSPRLFVPRLFVLILSGALLAGCAALQPERSVGRGIDDTNASLSIKSAMLRSEGYALDNVDVEVTEGIALLTGTVPRDADRRMAECLAWSAIAVRSVENEVEVTSPENFRDRSRDYWIGQQVRSRLLRDRSVRSVNFNVEVEGGRVYLLGVARTRGELERAAGHAALVDGVSDVVTYVRVAGETTEPVSRGARQAAVCEGEAAPVRSGEEAELLGAAPDMAPPEEVRDAPVRPIDD